MGADSCCCCCRLECGVKCIGAMDIIGTILFILDVVAIIASYGRVGGPLAILYVQPLLMVVLV